MLGLDGLAVASAALEAACDEDGGDPLAALRAVELGRRELAAEARPDARVRHDLRGGLNIVIGHASLLELEPLTEAQQESVREILAAADAMTAVLNAIESEAPEEGRQDAVTAARHVLLVEDDPVTATMLARMLGELGATVAVVHTAADAVGAARRERPDVVVLDLGLPDADGRQVLGALRETPELSGIPVVVSSGDAGAAVGRELAARGASALLPKPVTMTSLRALLAAL